MNTCLAPYDTDMNNSVFGNQNANRYMGKAADSGVKFFFKWLGIAIVGLVNAIKLLISSALGK